MARLADAIAAILVNAGGSIATGQRVASRADLPPADVVMFETGAVADIVPAALPRRIHRLWCRPRRHIVVVGLMEP